MTIKIYHKVKVLQGSVNHLYTGLKKEKKIMPNQQIMKDDHRIFNRKSFIAYINMPLTKRYTNVTHVILDSITRKIWKTIKSGKYKIDMSIQFFLSSKTIPASS